MTKLPATMAYRGGRARERILAYGPMGSGKSTFARTLADVLGADDMLRVVDCDNRWDGILDNHPEIEGQVDLAHARDWDTFTKAFDYQLTNAARDDWLVVDSMTWPWQWIQRWYIKRTHGEDMPDFLLDHRMKQVKAGMIDRKDKADGGESAMLIEWSYLNSLWASKVAEPIVNTPCNLLLIAEGKQIRSDGRERGDVVDLFGSTGFKPESQWRLGFQVRSVLLFTKSGRQEFFFDNSVKDDEREVGKRTWTDEGIKEYLVKVAGWKPKKVDVDE